MFYSDTDILVAQAQHRDRLQAAAQKRLIQEIQQSNHRGPVRSIRSWINKLLLKPIPNHSIYLGREKPQLI